MRNLLKAINCERQKTGIENLSKDSVLILSSLWDFTYSADVILPFYGKGETEEFIKIAKEKKASEKDFLYISLHTILEFTTLYESYRYSRQIIGLRILESIDGMVKLIHDNKIGLACTAIRLAVESIAVLNYVNSDIESKLYALKTILNTSGESFLGDGLNLKKINENILEYDNICSGIRDMVLNLRAQSKIDWYNYIQIGKVIIKEQDSIHFNTSQFFKYGPSIDKLVSTSKPHNTEDWKTLYNFLCDFSHPSIGSRIIGNDEGFATSVTGLVFVQKKISREPESNDIREKIISDSIKYIDDVLSLWKEIDEKSILIENALSIMGKGYIRIMFAYHNAKKSGLYKQLKAVWPPYERCLCWSRDSHFKFCCGDEQNWLKMFPI